jgi:hypothetical protein
MRPLVLSAQSQQPAQFAPANDRASVVIGLFVAPARMQFDDAATIGSFTA